MTTLSHRYIESLKASDKDYAVMDDSCPGLGIMVYPSGRKAFLHRYTISKKRKRPIIAHYPETSLHDARIIIRENRTMLDKNIDPASYHKEQRRLEEESPTVSQLMEMFIVNKLSRRKRPEQPISMINNVVLPAWGKIKVKDIKRHDVMDLLEPIALRAPVRANRIQSLIGQFFRYARNRGIIEIPPTYDLDKVGGTENPRDRVLENDELHLIWNNLESCKNISLNIKTAIRVLIVSGQRSEAILKAKWDEVDFKNNIWTIPAINSKNGIKNKIPIEGTLGQLFRELKLRSNKSQYIMPSPQGDKSVSERTICKAVERIRKQLPIEHFTAHDFRTTVITRLVGLKVNIQTIDKIMNHKDQTINKHYNHHDYMIEKAEALQLWHNSLRAITAIRNNIATN